MVKIFSSFSDLVLLLFFLLIMRKTSGESEWVRHKMSMIKVFSSNLMTSDERYSHICRMRDSHGVQNLVNFTSPEDTKNKSQKTKTYFLYSIDLCLPKKKKLLPQCLHFLLKYIIIYH